MQVTPIISKAADHYIIRCPFTNQYFRFNNDGDFLPLHAYLLARNIPSGEFSADRYRQRIKAYGYAIFSGLTPWNLEKALIALRQCADALNFIEEDIKLLKEKESKQ